jgi:dTDP-4-dehydrorhamnose 3,5-epimerase
MKFFETKLEGAFIIRIEKIEDERGFFARAWCKNDFEKNGLSKCIVQANISHSNKKGTLRGLHYQIKPFQESKLIRCVKGAIYDVIVDLRQDSLTFKRWISVNLSQKDYDMLYVPEGFAHGFLTLEDETGVFYEASQFYSPEHERGIRYNDPSFDIEWPIEVEVSSDKDRNWPDFAL